MTAHEYEPIRASFSGMPMVEDENFTYGGYWKGQAGDVIEGDGIRFDDSIDAGVIVHDVSRNEAGQVVMVVSSRSAHVARVVSDAFHRPIEGMSADPQPGVHVMDATDPVWVRM